MDFAIALWESKMELIQMRDYITRLKQGIVTLRESCSILQDHYGPKPPPAFYYKELVAFATKLENILYFLSPRPSPHAYKKTLRKFLTPIVNNILELNPENELLLDLN